MVPSPSSLGNVWSHPSVIEGTQQTAVGTFGGMGYGAYSGWTSMSFADQSASQRMRQALRYGVGMGARSLGFVGVFAVMNAGSELCFESRHWTQPGIAGATAFCAFSVHRGIRTCFRRSMGGAVLGLIYGLLRDYEESLQRRLVDDTGHAPSVSKSTLPAPSERRSNTGERNATVTSKDHLDEVDSMSATQLLMARAQRDLDEYEALLHHAHARRAQSVQGEGKK